MRVLHLLLPLLFLALPAWADQECAQCKPPTLCAPHQAQEKAALEAFKAAFKDKDSEKRIAALDALAKVNQDHANARSRLAAVALAGALKDPAYEVRAQAARLLGTTQEAGVAFKALSAETDVLLKRLGKVDLGKARGTPDYERDLQWLRLLYEGLAATKSRDAAPFFARGLEMTNAEVIEAAADRCSHLRVRPVIDAMIAALGRLAQATATPETTSAWHMVCKYLPKVTGHTEVKPQKDGDDAPRFARDWDSWWRENKKKKEFD